MAEEPGDDQWTGDDQWDHYIQEQTTADPEYQQTDDTYEYVRN